MNRNKSRAKSRPKNQPRPSAGQNNVTTEHQVVTETLFQGPVPDPQTLSHYGQVDVTFPPRIMAMSEEQAAHRQKLETMSLTANISAQAAEARHQQLGQRYAFVVAIAGLAASILLGYVGAGLAALLAATTSATSAATALLGKRLKS